MVSMLKTLKTLAACALLSAMAVAPASARQITPEAQVKAMGRGVNLLGYDPLWKDPAKAQFQIDRHFKVIKAGGFDTVRINLQAFEHMDAENRLSPEWFKTLDRIVAAALAEKLTVILDEHDFQPCAKDPDACKPRLFAFWKQVSNHYENAPDSVVFELLNEPYGGLTDLVWNSWVAELLPIVRITNPTRNIIIGPAWWNTLDHLKTLELPASDRHLIATFHYYAPMEFTHQGAAWNPSTPKTGVTWGTPEEIAKVGQDLDRALAWSKANNRPILLGEFGAYDKADMASRAAYNAAVARAAEARGFAWAYWQFNSDFVLYDVKADRWVEPIHNALVPR